MRRYFVFLLLAASCSGTALLAEDAGGGDALDAAASFAPPPCALPADAVVSYEACGVAYRGLPCAAACGVEGTTALMSGCTITVGGRATVTYCLASCQECAQ